MKSRDTGAHLAGTTGVRPSPGAATSANSGVSQYANVPDSSVPAAPGDGRTPIQSLVSLPGAGATLNMPEPLSNSGVSFPLTPALSLGERVPRPPSLEMPACQIGR